jgi:hemerythrin
MIIEWSDDLVSGVAHIDSQHKLIIKKFGELLTACKNGMGREEAVEMVQFMHDYCLEHFELEEQHMKDHDYPYFLSHAREHRDFKQRFNDMSEDIDKNGVSLQTVLYVNHNLISWFLGHIRGTDIKMCKALKDKIS